MQEVNYERLIASIQISKMVKSAMNLLATNKQFKNGLLTGMILAKQIAKDKKKALAIAPGELGWAGIDPLPNKKLAAAGGKKIKGGFSFKKALAVAAGPLGWLWLAARHKGDKELKEVQKKLEKYEPPASKSKQKTVEEDFPIDEMEDYADDNDFDYDEFE